MSADIERTLGKARSPHWHAVRAAHLARHPACSACGNAAALEVHHVRPFHVEPALELDPANLLTLCEAPGRSCHFWVAHCGRWAWWNEDVRADAALLLGRIERARGRAA